MSSTNLQGSSRAQLPGEQSDKRKLWHGSSASIGWQQSQELAAFAPVVDVVLHEALVGLLHVGNGHNLAFAHNVVLAAEVQHLLRLLDAADHAATHALAACTAAGA